MTQTSPKFSAAPSAAGYLYQARLALALCLQYVNGDASISVGIERLDDVTFEVDGLPFELLQTKHHIDRAASLADKSPDLWKTLRVWSEAVLADPTLPSRTRLALVTTAEAPSGSIASLLLPSKAYATSERRDPAQAAERLTAIAEAGGNEELKSAHAAFLKLIPRMRASLVSAVEVLDNQPLVTDVADQIEESLRLMAPRGQAQAAREMLEGWWWGRVCFALIQKPSEAITILEIEAKLDDIRESLKRGVLTAEYEHAQPSEDQLAGYEGDPFIRQLRIIGVTGLRADWAKRDYYRAFTQRSKWIRDSLVFDGEIARFEQTLIEEWQPRFERIVADTAGAIDDQVRRSAGQEVFAWMETDARFPFRAVVHRFLNVGSYHILANDLRVGWHPQYERLCALHEADA